MFINALRGRHSWRRGVSALALLAITGSSATAVTPHLRIEVANGDDGWGRYVWAKQGDRVKVRVIADHTDVPAYGLSGVLYNVFTQGTQDGDDFVVDPEFVGNRRPPYDFGYQRSKILREPGKLRLGAEGASAPGSFGEISSAQKPPTISPNYDTSLQSVLLQFEMTIGNSNLRSFNIDAVLGNVSSGAQFAFHASSTSSRSDLLTTGGATEYAMVIIPAPGAVGLLAIGGFAACRRRRC